MAGDVPPKDPEVLAKLASVPGGLTPRELMDALVADGHSADNVVRAIQRVFDRGLLELGAGAKLVKVPVPVAA